MIRAFIAWMLCPIGIHNWTRVKPIRERDARGRWYYRHEQTCRYCGLTWRVDPE